MNSARGSIGLSCIVLVAVASAACSADPGTGDGGPHDAAIDAHGDAASDLGTDGSNGDSSTGDAGDANADAICGSNRFDLAATPPNVLILLDRSCSMRRRLDNNFATEGDGTSKWDIAVSALHALTARYTTQVRWGIISLPRNGSATEQVTCGTSPVCGGSTACPQVAPAPGSASQIDAEIDRISPFPTCSNGTQSMITPIYDGLVASGMVTQLHDAARQNFVLLVTDGQESCQQSQVVPGVTALRSANIRTAVIGFGMADASGVDPVQLNAMADAGGLAAMGATHYYAADNATSLQTALATIIGSTLSCTFRMSSPPSDVSRLHVYVDATTELTRDTTHATGWDYDAASQSITLYGTTCSDVQALRYSQIDVLETCGGGNPPPPTMCHHNGGSCDSDGDCCNLEGLACDTIHHVCIPAPG